jgi:hypothetical protein
MGIERIAMLLYQIETLECFMKMMYFSWTILNCRWKNGFWLLVNCNFCAIIYVTFTFCY